MAEMTDDQLREQRASRICQENIPVIVYICVVVLLGIVGNAAAVLFYKRIYKRSATSFLLFILPINDLSVSVINIIQAYYLCVEGTVSFGLSCNINSVAIKTLFMNSYGLLLLIALARYFVQCPPSPSWYFTVKKAKYCTIAAGVMAFLLSSTYFVIYTDINVPVYILGNRTVFGYFCRQSQEREKQSFIFAAYIIDITVCAIVVMSLVVLYVLILLSVLRKRRRLQTRNSYDPSLQDADEQPWSTFNLGNPEIGTKDQGEEVQTVPKCDGELEEGSQSCKVTRQTLKRRSALKKMKGNSEEKITLTMFAITLTSLMSLIPFIISRFFTFQPGYATLGSILLRSYMLNNTINPYVIILVNKDFRQFIRRGFINSRLGNCKRNLR